MRVEFTLSIGYPGAKQVDIFNLPECDEMEEKEREIYLEQYWQEWAWEYIDGGWKELN